MKNRLALGIALLLVIITSSYSFAEFEIRTSVKGGLTLNWVIADIDISDITGVKNSSTRYFTSNPFFTGNGGAFVEFSYLFSGSIFIYGVGLEIGLTYSGRGIDYGDGPEEEAHYLGLPVMFKMRGPFTEYLWAGVGIVYQRLLSYKSSFLPSLNKNHLELIIGCGFQVPVTNTIEIVGDFITHVGLTPYAQDKTRTVGLNVMLGVSFKVY